MSRPPVSPAVADALLSMAQTLTDRRLEAERLAHAGAHAIGEGNGWTYAQLSGSLSQIVIETIEELARLGGVNPLEALAMTEDIRAALRKINDENRAAYERTINAKAMGS